jgi:CubicO group peptidase (beta-lactamase class C family)
MNIAIATTGTTKKQGTGCYIRGTFKPVDVYKSAICTKSTLYACEMHENAGCGAAAGSGVPRFDGDPERSPGGDSATADRVSLIPFDAPPFYRPHASPRNPTCAPNPMKTLPPRSHRGTATVLAFSLLVFVFTTARPEVTTGRDTPGASRDGFLGVHDPGRRGGPGELAGNNPPSDWAYVAVGPLPAWETDNVELRRGLIDDHNMSGGTLIHPAGAGGGTSVDAWSGVIMLPFYFHLYGVPFDRFCVSKSGLLTFSVSVANTTTFIKGQSGAWALDGLQTTTSGRDHDDRTTGIDSVSQEGDGAVYFGELDLTPGNSNDPLGLPHPDIPNNTIAYFWGTYLPFSAADIYIFIYGEAPHRQAWIVNAGHRKKGHPETHTAVVLEETSNRVFVVDMHAGNTAKNGFLTIGIQRDPTSAHQLAMSPRIPVTGVTPGAEDNAFYLLQPYRRHELITGQGHPNLAQVDPLVMDWMELRNAPGATVAASQGGRLVFAKAYGLANVEAGLPMQPFHRSGIGSVSKVITALSVMRLVELAAAAGVPLSLDEPIYGNNGLLAAFDYGPNILNGIVEGLDSGEYLFGSGPFWHAAYHRISLRHLLTHTSGFRSGGDPFEAALYFDVAQDDLTYSQIHRHFLDLKPLLSPPPGTPPPTDPDGFLQFPPPPPAYAYSNHGFGLCGHIVEAVGGVPYIPFTQAFIFAPLGLQVAHAATHSSELTPLDARRYDYFTGGVPYHTSHFDGSRVYGAYGWKRGDLGAAAGGWSMPARDLVRLMCATDQLGNQPDILAPATLNEMESVPYPEVQANQAHGWGRSDNGTLRKDGKFISGVAYMAKYASGINVAIVVNTGAISSQVKDRCDEIEVIVKNAGVPATYDLFGGPPEGSP